MLRMSSSMVNINGTVYECITLKAMTKSSQHFPTKYTTKNAPVTKVPKQH